MNSKPLSKALRRLKDCSLLHLRHMQVQYHLALAPLLVSFAITTTTQSVRAESTPFVEGQVIAQFKEPLPL